MNRRSLNILALALSAAGLGIAIYLTALHYTTAVELACPSGGIVNCETVLSSPQSVILGLPVALFGAVWFLVNLVLQALRRNRAEGASPDGFRRALLAWLGIGAASVVYLVYTELVVIGRICIWCTSVHLIILLLIVLEVVSERQEAPQD